MTTWPLRQATAANWHVWLTLSSLQKEESVIPASYWYCGNSLAKTLWHQNDFRFTCPLGGWSGDSPQRRLLKRTLNVSCVVTRTIIITWYMYANWTKIYMINFNLHIYADVSSSRFSELPFLLVLGYYQLKLILPVSQWLGASFENPIIRLFV